MRSKFSIMGHPLHPSLVAVPVGLFGWALLADIIYLGSARNHMWYDIAFWTGIAAFLSALLAALPGFGDYFTMALNSSERATATAHMLFHRTTAPRHFA